MSNHSKKDKTTLLKLVNELEKSQKKEAATIIELNGKLEAVNKKNQGLQAHLAEAKLEMKRQKNSYEEKLQTIEKENLQLKEEAKEKDLLMLATLKTAGKLCVQDEQKNEKNDKLQKREGSGNRAKSRSESQEQDSPCHTARSGRHKGRKNQRSESPEYRRHRSTTPDKRRRSKTPDRRRQKSRTPDRSRQRSRSGERKRIDHRYYPRQKYQHQQSSYKTYQQKQNLTLTTLQQVSRKIKFLNIL